MSSQQCNGTAKLGPRCKIMVKDGAYCHYHIGQSGSNGTYTPKGSPQKLRASTPNRIVVTLAKATPYGGLPVKSRSPQKRGPGKDVIHKPGFIYIFTLASLMTRDGGDFFKTRNLELEKKGQWVNFSPKRLEYMFVKVGMTTKTVDLRLLQWEKQCNHKLVCLHPGSEGKDLTLVEKLKRLSIRKDKYPYHTFQPSDKGFYAGRSVWQAEQEIHGFLKQRYGGGTVYCQGCIDKAKEEEKGSRLLKFFKRKEETLSEYKVHVEWFPIPKSELREVFRIVDTVCMRYKA
ncbi:hypothetical protein C7M61_000092 [Candidozyma pseudohaemuli]|uniref:DUF1766-domain-containing protein n=1 Tax=Candidozyma pseudohaemuli TaxID=418784 RepID=A0A2P7YWX2_9ASCO|nr:hypothetical protein C7M61_000092 [[Candida] pseudohaemulonii]PSK40452.1 hypothetical protein C7M61_000092 [[Candida] pseudohaemulonii]